MLSAPQTLLDIALIMGRARHKVKPMPIRIGDFGRSAVGLLRFGYNTCMTIRFTASLALSTLLMAFSSPLTMAAATRKAPAVRTAKSAQSGPALVDAIFDGFVDDLWKQTDVYWHEGDYPRIIALDRIIVQADPHFAECYATGGWLMESLGRKSDAEAFYQQGVANNRDVSYTYYNLGCFYYNTLKDYAASAEVFRQDAKVADTQANDYKMLAHSYERLGRLKEALATWQAVKKRWPDAPAIEPNMNRVKAKLASAVPSSAPRR